MDLVEQRNDGHASLLVFTFDDGFSVGLPWLYRKLDLGLRLLLAALLSLSQLFNDEPWQHDNLLSRGPFASTGWYLHVKHHPLDVQGQDR